MYFTVGRNPQSNIVITGYDVVSFDHATIEYDESTGQFLFIDDSSNGSMVNGKKYHHASCPIKQGDVIMLAGVCPLPWDRIAALVPGHAMSEQPMNSRPTQVRTPHVEPQQPQYQQPQQPQYQPPQQPQYQPPQQPQYQPQQQSQQTQGRTSTSSPNDKELERNLDKWNWGAFCLTWIWGICNHSYLMLIALLPIANIVMAIIGGVKGTRWAWEGGNWKPEDYERFATTQKNWMIAGLIVLGVGVLLTVLSFSLFSMYVDSFFGLFDIFDLFDDLDLFDLL